MIRQPSLFSGKDPREIKIPTAMFALPKIDLHRHLIGSISVPALLTVAKEHNLLLPTDDPQELSAQLTLSRPVDGLGPYFRPWSILSRFLISPAVVSSFVYEALREARLDNIIYTELRVGWGMTGHESFSVDAFLAGVEDGIRRAERDFGIIARLLFGITRHLFARHGPGRRKQLWSEIIRSAIRYQDAVVVGFDFSGIEEGFPLHLFFEEFQDLRHHGFSFSVHCGETTPADNVRDALAMSPSRISHALSIVRDEGLMRELAATCLSVEVCPTSNWLVGVVPELSEHPVKRMHQAGISITLNTDNPAICQTTLSKEQSIVTSLIGLPFVAIQEFTANALRAMFVTGNTRRIVERQLDLFQRQV